MYCFREWLKILFYSLLFQILDTVVRLLDVADDDFWELFLVSSLETELSVFSNVVTGWVCASGDHRLPHLGLLPVQGSAG